MWRRLRGSNTTLKLSNAERGEAHLNRRLRDRVTRAAATADDNGSAQLVELQPMPLQLGRAPISVVPLLSAGRLEDFALQHVCSTSASAPGVAGDRPLSSAILDEHRSAWMPTIAAT